MTTAAVTAAESMARNEPEVDPQAAKQRYRETLAAWDGEYSKVRRVLYTDVEELISAGFLAHSVRVGDVTLSLRSLSPGDIHLLAHRCGRGAADYQWKTWAIASSVWMVKGLCLLEDPWAVNRVHDIIREFPRAVVDILFSVLLGLFNRTATALSRTEAYCYEPYSRVLWRMYGRQIPSTDGLSGIPGASRLGMNHIQRLWVAHNTTEDDRDILTREWQAAKLVASAMSPSGTKKLSEADDRLHERDREVAEQMVHVVLYGEQENDESGAWHVVVQGQLVEVPAVRIARSPDELEEQFRAWVAGEHDWHDVVVDTYKARIAAQFNKEKVERNTLLEDATREEPGVDGGLNEGQLVGYTLQQLRDLRPELLASKPGARRILDDSKPAHIFQKYVAQEASPGRLRVGANGVYELPRPAQPSLQDQVAGRKPVLSTEPIGPGSGGGDG